MNTKQTARVAALIVAVLLAGAVMWTWTAPATGPGAPPQGTAPAVGTGGDWDPNVGGTTDPRTTKNPSPAPAPPAKTPEPLPPMPEVGTAVAQGQEVAIALPWKRGEENVFHYEIHDVLMARDRNSGDHDPTIDQWHVTLEVVEGDGSGAARIRFTLDWFHLYALQPSGIPYDVDSREPDSPFLEIAEVARRVKPMLAFVGRPLEFEVDAAGNVVDVRGFDDWHDRYVDAVRQIEKGSVAEPDDAPTKAQIMTKWSEFLFPVFGGGKVAGGTPRRWTRVEPQVPPWSIAWTGTLEATRDDPDAFRVDVFASPEAKQTGGTPAGAAVQIAAVRAIGDPKSYHAAYRFGRTPGALLQAQIEAKYQLWISYKTGAARGQPAFAPRYFEIVRRVEVRRTKD